MIENEHENTYIGLTIGPIFKTIEHAKRTGELWGSSYLFSYIMKNIIRELRKDKEIKSGFIVPYVSDNAIFEKPMGVGLFHDRLIFKSNEGDFEKVRKIVEEVKAQFKKDVFRKLKNSDKSDKDVDQRKVEEYIENYFKIYFLEIEVNPNDENKDDRNIIFKVSKYLDAIELKEQFVDEEETNYLFKILNNKEIKDSFLAKDAYGENGRKEEYPSLLNIALKELIKEHLFSDDKEVRKNIVEIKEKQKIEIKKYHEYVAIVQVDGDFMGKKISQFKLNNEEEKKFKEYRDFSKNLLNYAQNSHKLIEEYGGFTIFAGGDDLLFIAPVANERSENKNIFKLIDKISEQFDKEFKIACDDKNKVTLSFGVAIVHYKYPLYFSLEESRNLLFGQAKSFKYEVNGQERKKNAIAFKVIKSSGESFGSVIGKESMSYKKFKELFNKILSSNKDKNIQNYLKSLHIKLFNDKVILNKIGKDKNLLQNYFYNNFDKSIHKKKEIKEYLNDVIELINQIYLESGEIGIRDNECINQIHSYLKFIKFMDEKSDLQDLTIQDIKDEEKGEKNG